MKKETKFMITMTLHRYQTELRTRRGEKKNFQKVNSYKQNKITKRESELLNMDIPRHSVSAEEKLELANTVSKVGLPKTSKMLPLLNICIVFEAQPRLSLKNFYTPLPRISLKVK